MKATRLNRRPLASCARIVKPLALGVLCSLIWCGANSGVWAQNAKTAEAQARKEYAAALAAASSAFSKELEAVAKQYAVEGDFDTAKQVSEEKKLLDEHGVSPTPDPSASAKRILRAHLYRITDGAILDFRADYTAYGRHNNLTAPWTMTDQQTVILGAANPNKPLYIYKFNKRLTRGEVYKYQPVASGKRHVISRSGQ